MMRLPYLILLILLSPATSYAEVHSEIVFFLKPDGKNYLLERSIHTNKSTHRFHVDKSVQLEDLLHISPARFEWDDESSDELNSIDFDAGGFTLIYPSTFTDDELRKKDTNIYQYRSWDGNRNTSGRYGYWYHPEQFSHFTYTWIVPDNIEILSYRSNRHGTWTRRGNAVSFYTENKNNITFDIDFQVTPLATNVAQCEPAELKPEPVEKCTEVIVKPQPVPSNLSRFNSSKDSDKDKVTDPFDLCPETPVGARVDKTGCPLDNDHDGVPDGIDECIATEEGTHVNAKGCPAN